MRNFSPTKAVNEKPDVAHLKVFGCDAYMHIKKEQMHRNLIQDLESASLLGTAFSERRIVYLIQEQRNFMDLEMLFLLKMGLEVVFNIKSGNKEDRF